MRLIIQGIGNKEALAAYNVAQEARDISRQATNTISAAANTAANAASNVFLLGIANTINTAVQTQLSLSYSIDCGHY